MYGLEPSLSLTIAIVLLTVAVVGAMAGQGSSGSWWYVSAVADEETVVADEETSVAEEENHSEPPVADEETAVAEEETAVADEETLALEDAVPAAIAAGAQPANDGQPGPQVFDLDYFRSFRPFTRVWKQHNEALKYFRHLLEFDDPSQSPCWEFDASTPAAVAVIHHAAKGMTWDILDEWTEWSWHEMIAQLDEASMEEVVTGPSGRSRGLVGCSFAIRPGSYDHKRSHMLRQSTSTPIQHKLPYWDFVVHREDGSGIRLHPEWSKTFVETFEEPGHAEALAVVTLPPRRGFGRSDGRGTYAKYKNTPGTKQMRFDAAKKP